MNEYDETLDGVAQFHVAFGCTTRMRPEMPELTQEQKLDMFKLAHMLAGVASEAHRLAERHGGEGPFTRVQLITEECGELADSIARGDLVNLLRELADLTYVVDGSYLHFGLGGLKLEAFREVQRANMSKLDAEGRPVKNAAGRVQKPPGWTPPDLGPMVELALNPTRREP